MKVLKKIRCPFRGIALHLIPGSLLVASLLVGGCSNLFSAKPAESPGREKGAVVVNLSTDVAARTLLPSASELFYTLTFTKDSATVIETLGGGVRKTVTLENGTWNLAVHGYRNPADAYPLGTRTGTATATGNKTGIVVSGTSNATVTVGLSAVPTGTGTLRYSLSYPSSPPASEIILKLEKRGEGYSQTLSLSPNSYGAGGQLPLPSGHYDISFYLYNGRIAVSTELVHIYDKLETPASFVLTAADFAAPPDTGALENALRSARTVRDETVVSANGTGVDPSRYWISPTGMTALKGVIADAEAIMATHGAGMLATELATAAGTLNAAVAAFISVRTTGAYDPAGDAANLGLFKGSVKQGAGTTLAEALEWLKNNNGSINNGDSYTVVLGADESLASWTLGGSGMNTAIAGKTNVTLTLTGKGMERMVSLITGDSLFMLGSGVTLVLDEHITLRGRPNNTAALLQTASPGAALVMNPGSKITGNSSSFTHGGGGVYVSDGTFTMNGGIISGNTAYSGGGGVYVSGGTFTMNTGIISGNTTSYGGGVHVSGGTFTMNGGTISGNTAYSYGGGVYALSGGAFAMSGGEISGNAAYSGGGVCVDSGTFTMGGGKLSGNTASSAYGGGVYVNHNGAFVMSGGEISGNTAFSSSGDNGVYVDSSGASSGSFVMSGGARVNSDNPVYLAASSDAIAALGIGGDFTGATGPVASLVFDSGLDLLKKAVIKRGEGLSGPLPADRISLPSGWTADSNGVLDVSAVPLTASGAGAYLSPGAAHFYRFAPTLNKTYAVTLTKENYGSSLHAAVAWADGSGTLAGDFASNSPYGGTSPNFVATKAGVDIIVRIYNGTGNYTVKLNEE
jgi:hypothetical protein